ncbi:MAG: hypothetical protein PVF70_02010 [Anaerolineales bacterium]|jgi:hypothetical protein
MDPDPSVSDRLVRKLRRLGLDGIASVLLEVAGPLTLLGAQTVYFVEPLLGRRGGMLTDIARLLEDPAEVTALRQRLAGEEER